jgi:hypothetical protein
MHCYNHIDIDAIAICPACHKGICQNCLTQDNLVSCNTDSCKNKAKRIDEIINNNIAIVKKTNGSLILQRFSSIFIGLLFIVMGLVFLQKEESMFGLIFVGFGILPFFYGIYSIIKKNFLFPES